MRLDAAILSIAVVSVKLLSFGFKEQPESGENELNSLQFYDTAYNTRNSHD